MRNIKLVKTLLGALVLGAATLTSPQKAAAQSYVIGEIITVGYNFCPRGTFDLEGQLLAVSQNDALFSLLGTIYGGDGRTTFGLPHTRGRSLLGQGSGPGLGTFQMGSFGGQTIQTMSVLTLPQHSHEVRATNRDGDKPGPGGKLLAAAPPGGVGSETIYSTAGANRQMSDTMLSTTGGQQSFPIRDPSLGMRFCIIANGPYPSRS
ncbi:tail fiber protein [Phaeobacter sp. J2-8]|uniref:phage tail protein n=1 Tax=Phaeobacter sp. J2-8 TaxID=2931394 RepID=UPI001FD28B7F|nr:tail fiber protein [Phaeobacter sp. J2-8]MCJ7874803.1 tail fiber protein [Phaeobacter sp. J2-8]